MKQGLIYHNLIFYRTIMQLLYWGKYKSRFYEITTFIDSSNVVELCFGDIVIADFCTKNHISWIGYDINVNFVGNAIDKGYKAELIDLNLLTELPKTDLIIMSGSLYHFQENLENLFSIMLKSTNKIIISEPIKNLASQNNFLGRIASKMTTVNQKNISFRFNKESLLDALNSISSKLNFRFKIVKELKKDLIIIIEK